MENKPASGTRYDSGVVLGTILVIAGVLYLIERFTPFDVGQYGWPLFVIVAGLALIAIGIASRSAIGLAVPGSIATVVGLILAVQNAFGLWATWSYAWALVFPGAIGVGTAIMGAARGDRRQLEGGVWAALTGVGLFAVFGLFFEGVLHVSGVDFGPVADVALPLCVIAVGLVLLLAAAFSRRRAD